MLRDVDDVLSERNVSSQQRKDLDGTARGCRDVLNRLREKLDKSQELDSIAEDISGKPRRIWRSFQWDQAEIDQLRNQINLNITAFGTLLGQITRCHIAPPFVVERLGAYLS